MKKIAMIAILALVVAGCIFAAGCTTQQTPDIPSAVSISVTKEGTAYNVGDICELRFPSNGSTGYQWMCTQSDDGLKVSMNYRAPEIDMPGAQGLEIIWLSSENAGTYNFTLKYMRSWEGEESAVATYSDSITFVDNPEAIAINGPRASFVYDTFSINPTAGDYVKISVRGNPTTGYTWKASGDGLTIKDTYVVDEHEEGMVGVGGTYYWYVTADKAGTYTFKAEEARSWEGEAITGFTIPLIFL
ncbi:MAG TPA: protease inhibitor I42 family protein [Methanocorpusculum sp.]|nr:protease inhibitor I42 family protein [Methanocorpusculum sp.]HJJ39853.1 protease inhibitor I42 family protein [Methanocorpusculum sp.]HJJ49194.1 protease inhibitor I42 family protein [Methanocorpusculum sp.]HJJ56852.1 protease inhibitor I42 family protein [Methanocorpusculum sp.]